MGARSHLRRSAKSARRDHHQSLCADPDSWRCRRNYHRDYCGQVGRVMVVTKVSDVGDLLTQARQNPYKSFPAILKPATSEDWKEREVAARKVCAEWAKGKNADTTWIIKDGLRKLRVKHPNE